MLSRGSGACSSGLRMSGRTSSELCFVNSDPKTLKILAERPTPLVPNDTALP